MTDVVRDRRRLISPRRSNSLLNLVLGDGLITVQRWGKGPGKRTKAAFVRPIVCIDTHRLLTTMFSKLVICAIVGLASLVAASDPTTPQRLRAKSNSTSLAYNGFYFGTYHKGAGLADATLLANSSEALAGAFLNATANVTTSAYYLDFNTTISTGGSSVEYYHAQITGTGGYESMKLMTVSLAEPPSEGFSFDSQGRLAYQNSTDFAACEWTHAV